MTFMIGEKEDRRLVVTESGMSIISMSYSQHQTFMRNCWARFLAVGPQVDEETKELNQKTRKVAYCEHIGDGFFMSVNDGFTYFRIRKYFMP